MAGMEETWAGVDKSKHYWINPGSSIAGPIGARLRNLGLKCAQNKPTIVKNAHKTARHALDTTDYILEKTYKTNDLFRDHMS